MSTLKPPSNSTFIVPLVSTTTSLSLAIFGALFFKTHLNAVSGPIAPDHKASVARSLSLWWRHSRLTTLPTVLALITASLVSGIRAYRSLSPILQSTQRKIALAGTLLAVGHLAFAPKFTGVIRDMGYAYERVGDWRTEGGVDAEEQGRTKEEIADEAVLEGQRAWLRAHLWRTLLTDLPAWGCFAWLVLGSE